MPYRVFLSYTRLKDDFGAVSAFRNHLENELRRKTGDKTLTVFQDTVEIGSGERFAERLRAELDAAHILIVLLSPTWLKSDWCRSEYDIYRNSNPTPRPIVPILWDLVEPSRLNEDERDVYHDLVTNVQMAVWDRLQYQSWQDPQLLEATSKLAKDTAKLFPL